MSQQIPAEFEKQIQTIAGGFSYPPTPDIAAVVRQQSSRPTRPVIISRQLVWAALAVGLILAGLLAVPQVRAAVVEFLQLGSVRIFLTEPTPTPPPPIKNSSAPVTATPQGEVIHTSLENLAGETTLAEAQAQVDFPIRLPAELGPPDKVYLQELGGSVVVLVWLDSWQPDRARLSLHYLGANTFAQKMQPEIIEETAVHGQPALWTTGPYLLQFLQNNEVIYDTRRLIEGHVLIWMEDGITYRLESDLSLNEAVEIAESLR